MEQIISLDTLNILALSKLSLAIFVGLFLFGYWRKYRPIYFLSIFGALIVLFYIVLAKDSQRMWWGTVGDELLVSGYLGHVMFGDAGKDFYYAWLPNFYPPLYFWVTGFVAKFFVHSGIAAAKVGIIGTLIIWFWGTYYWQKLFWSKIFTGDKHNFPLISNKWFFALLPIFLLLISDFDALLLKPYEALAALLCVIWLIFWSVLSIEIKWTKTQYLFLGLSAGLLFLLFYFWWFILLPLIFVLALRAKGIKTQLKRFVINGVLMALVSVVFWGPLLISFIKYGIENWQAKFFIFSDLFTFSPWSAISWRAMLLLLGLVGLVYFYKKNIAVKSIAGVLIFSYLYQLLSVVLYLTGYHPVQAYKPFMFLGGAALAVGLTMIALHIFSVVKEKYAQQANIFLLVVLIVIFSQVPLIRWLDDPVVIHQIENDLQVDNRSQKLVGDIKKYVPDYQSRTWLTSGTANLNAYLPLSYYIAFSPHFSHQAAQYSERLAEVQAMSRSQSASDFMNIIKQGKKPQIDSLLFYDDQANNLEGDFTLFFWADRYPNGGQDLLIKIPKKLINEQNWQEVYSQDNWRIFIEK